MTGRRLILALPSLALGVLAAVLILTTGTRHEQLVPAFVTKTLGSTQSTSKQPQSLATSGLHATINGRGYTASDGRSKWLSLTSATGRAVPWKHYTHGVSRRTSFGYQTITMTPGSVEEFDTVLQHHGIKTWRWHIGSPNLKPYLTADGTVHFRGGKKTVGLHVPAVQIFDSSNHAITPAGARWSLRHAKSGWFLELRLNDALLPLPYTIDPSVTTVSFTGSPQTALALADWTVGFTSSATGTLSAGSTITVVFNPSFTVPAVPAITLGSGFVNCSATGAAVAQTVTVTLVGGSCALAPTTAATLAIAGLTNPVANTYLANTFSVKTSADSTSAVNPGAAVVIAAATAPTLVTVSSTTLALSSRATWTANFTSSATGALRTGDTITVAFTAGFVAPNPGTIILGKGFKNCLATGTGVTTTETITLADNGGTCTLPLSTAASLQILGVTNGSTLGAVQPTLKTSGDTTALAATAVTMVAATAPTLVTVSSTTLALSARATWTANFTSSATGALRTGDTITVAFTAGFVAPNPGTIILGKGFSNCSASGTGAGVTETITLADNGGTCTLPLSTAASMQIHGVTNGVTLGAVQPTLKTASDTTALAATAVTMVAATRMAFGSVTVSSTSLALNARATWTVNIVPTATGSLRNGDTITVAFTVGFVAPNPGTIILGQGFKNCSATGAGAGTTETITLADSGGTCTLPNSTAASFQILDVTNGATAGAVTPSLTTSSDTTARTATAVTMVAATAPTLVTVSSTTLALSARATWTANFTSSASGALNKGDTITVAFTAGFVAPNPGTIILGKGFSDCSATGTGAGTTETITLADSGGTCALPVSTAASLQIVGVTNGSTLGAVQPTLATSVDTTALAATAVTMVAATAPTLVTVSSTTLALSARATWTANFTSSATGSLRTGDTITVAFTAGFVAPNPGTIILGKGFKNCSATGTGAGTTETITLADNGATCTVPNSTAASLQIVGVTNGSTLGAVQPTLKTSSDTTALAATAVTMVAATAPTLVTVSSTTLALSSRATWTANFTSSATGSLRTGDTITVAFTAGFVAPNPGTIILGKGFKNCLATGTGAGVTETITLADNGGTCTLPLSTAASLQIVGVTNGSTLGAVQPTLKTSSDTTALAATAVTMVAATTPTAVTVSSTSLTASRVATWTANFTTSATGSLQAGDTITATFSAAFNTATATTAAVLTGFTNCSATVSGVGLVATITLADFGGTCALADSTAASLAITGITNTSTTGASTETIKTSADTTAANATAVTIVAQTSPTLVTVSSTSLVALARATWTVNFKTSSTGTLRSGDTITTTFSSGFSVSATPTITLGAGFSNCSATATGAGAVATITLANSGGTCVLPPSTAASLTIAGVTNSSAGGSTETVKTSADAVAANATLVTITATSAPTAVSFSGAPQNGSARSTWTVGFTATSALLDGDAITVAIPTGFSLPTTPAIALTGGGYASCAATGAASGTTLTVTLSGASCALTAGQSGAFTVAGIVNGPAATYTNTGFTVATTDDTTPASPAGNVTITAATAPTAVTFAGAPQNGGARSTWTVGYTATTALKAGDTITISIPAGFAIPTSPTITLGGAYTGTCTSPASTTSNTSGSTTGPTLTITLPATCALAAAASGSLTIAGITNAPAAAYLLANWTVNTSADTTPASPAGNVTITAATAPTAVTFAGAPQNGGARSTWTVGYTATTALKAGDTITISIPAGFAIPTSPTITLGGAYAAYLHQPRQHNQQHQRQHHRADTHHHPARHLRPRRRGLRLTHHRRHHQRTRRRLPPRQLDRQHQRRHHSRKPRRQRHHHRRHRTHRSHLRRRTPKRWRPLYLDGRLHRHHRPQGRRHNHDQHPRRLRDPDQPDHHPRRRLHRYLHQPRQHNQQHQRQHHRADTHHHPARHLRPRRRGLRLTHHRRHHQRTRRRLPPRQLDRQHQRRHHSRKPAANVTITAATAPTAVTFAGAPTNGGARSTWTVGYTATTALKAGDTITISIPAGFAIPTSPTITLGGAYAGTCTSPASTTSTTPAAAPPGRHSPSPCPPPAPSPPRPAHSPSPASPARPSPPHFSPTGPSTPAPTPPRKPRQRDHHRRHRTHRSHLRRRTPKTVAPALPGRSATPQPTALKAGDTITISIRRLRDPDQPDHHPRRRLHRVPAPAPPAQPATTSGSTTGPTLTITLPPPAPSPPPASGSLTIAGITNPPAAAYLLANWTVNTSADTTPQAPPATSPSPPPPHPPQSPSPAHPKTVAPALPGRSATATTALKAGDTITISIPPASRSRPARPSPSAAPTPVPAPAPPAQPATPAAAPPGRHSPSPCPPPAPSPPRPPAHSPSPASPTHPPPPTSSPTGPSTPAPTPLPQAPPATSPSPPPPHPPQSPSRRRRVRRSQPV